MSVFIALWCGGFERLRETFSEKEKEKPRGSPIFICRHHEKRRRTPKVK